MKKEIPRFKNEKEEADFWDNNDSSEYIAGAKLRWLVSQILSPV